MCPFLEKRGWVVYCFNLIPNNGDVGLEVLAEQLDAYAERTFGGEQPFDLVGYSMGDWWPAITFSTWAA